MRVLLTGATGHLGAYLLHEASRQKIDVVAWSGATARSAWHIPAIPVNLADRAQVEQAFTAAAPDVVLHAAALAAIADCHAQPDRARQINVEGTRLLCEWCEQRSCRLLFVSTDLVFDGRRGHYRETDAPHPLSHYARTKREAEQVVQAWPRSLIVRLSWLLGPKLIGPPRFFDQLLQALRQGKPFSLFEDEWRTPLGLPQAARCLWRLALDSDVTGLLHLGGSERMSRYEMGQRLARHLGVREELILPGRRDQTPAPEPRPADVSLDSSRFRQLYPDIAWPGYEETLTEGLTLAAPPH